MIDYKNIKNNATIKSLMFVISKSEFTGVLFVFASFLFVSGTISNNRNLLAIALAVAFAYGSMIWGIFPFKPGISWEGHLMGMISGAFMAIWYRKEGPKRKKWSWEIEEEEEEKMKEFLDSQSDTYLSDSSNVYKDRIIHKDE